MNNLSYKDLIPDGIQDRLIHLQSIDRASSFEIGDITLSLVSGILGTTPGVKKSDIYSAVGSFCGKASRTVREYAYISGFYGPEERQKYEILSFDHLRIAARLGGAWDIALDWVVRQCDELGGRPASVDAMLARFGDFPTEPLDEALESDLDPEDDAEETSPLSEARKAAARFVAILRPFYASLNGSEQVKIEDALTTLSMILDIDLDIQ